MKKIYLTLIFALLLLALVLRGPDTPAQDPPEGEPLERFVPTEKLPADSAISFPVDI